MTLMNQLNASEIRLLDHVDALRDKQLQWSRELIAIPTVNPYSGDTSAGSEVAGQMWVEEKLRHLGAQTSRIVVPPDVYTRAGILGPAQRIWDDRENVIGSWTFGSRRSGEDVGRTVLVNDHMDTVGTEGMEIPPFDPVVKDGKLFGRGATDTKGNLVMGLIAIEALLRCDAGLNGRIIFESVVDEECDGAGAGTLACCLAGVRGDVAMVLDGSAGRIVNGCNGIATARLLVHGRAGHNAVGTVASAIDKAVTVKQAIDRFAAELVARDPTCRTNIGIFRAGTRASIVPSLAEMQVNMSYPVADAVEAQRVTGRWGGEMFRRRFEQAMREVATIDPWFIDKPVEVSWIKDPYPYLCDAEDAAIQVAANAARDVAGTPIPVAPMAAWFDGAHLARQLGIPTFSLGHGMPGCAHAAVEFALVEDLWRGAKTVALTLYRLLQTKRP